MSTVVVTSTENQGLVLERPPEKRRPLPRKAAGAQITHSQNEEVVKRNNDVSLFKADNRNGNTVNRLLINNWRASLVPAAAVIPAPIRKTKVAVFKKLVVEFRVFVASWSNWPCWLTDPHLLDGWRWSLSIVVSCQNVYFEKIRVLKAGSRLYILHGIMK